MKGLSKTLVCLLACFTLGIGTLCAKVLDNQTADTTTILSNSALPFRISIEQANFTLPVGLHSGVVGVYKGQWIFIAGRLNGLHGFDPVNNFPPDEQNTSIYVVNPATGSVSSRALSDPSSGLSRQQIDTLSVTSPQGYQEGNTLYMTGGYGVDTNSATFGTKPVLTAFNLPGIVDWVTQPGNPNTSVVNNMTQIYNQIFQITGGRMYKLGNLTQIVFGQDFEGPYTDGSNGVYSEQVRQFSLNNVGGQLSVNIANSMPSVPNPNFRRRDLNVVPVMLNNNNQLQYGLVAYAGVFTLSGGAWTVPVIMNGTNDPVMADPTLSTTFKQGMNQYVCATASLYSRKFTSNYNIFFGGLSYGQYVNGVFTVDAELPFINQVTTVQIDKNNNFTQYLMDGQYPFIPVPLSSPQTPLFFGAGAYFIPTNITQYSNRVLSLDSIRTPTVIGYIVGGIQSIIGDTSSNSDSAASQYVFKVTLTPT